MLTPSLVTPAMLLVGPLGFAVGSAVFLAGPVVAAVGPAKVLFRTPVVVDG